MTDDDFDFEQMFADRVADLQDEVYQKSSDLKYVDVLRREVNAMMTRAKNLPIDIRFAEIASNDAWAYLTNRGYHQEVAK